MNSDIFLKIGGTRQFEVIFDKTFNVCQKTPACMV